MSPDTSRKKKKAVFSLRNPYHIIWATALLFLGLYFFFTKFQNKGADTNQLKTKTIPDAIHKLIQNNNAKVEVNSIKEQSGVYEFEFTLNLDDKNPQKYTSYITRDGKIMFQSGIKLNLLAQQEIKGEQTQKKDLTCNDLSKSEAPRLTAYIVSNCPYGLQMQRLFKKALAELPQISPYLEVRYIGSIAEGKITSMHGEKEAQENLRQICLREEQKDKYWDYVSCYMQEGKTESCLNSTKVNMVSLNSCLADKNKGLKYAQVDFDLVNKLNIGSSPTLVLGDTQIVSEFGFGGRVTNAVKEILCCASKEKPEFCQKELSKENIATSFSQTDQGTGGGGASNCGN